MNFQQSPPPAFIRATDADSVTQERRDCLLNGFQPVEIKPGSKGETDDGSALRKDFLNFRGLPKFNPRYSSTSLLCETLRVFDFDLDDAEVLGQLLQLALESGIRIHDTIYRKRGNSLHVIFLFRAERPKGERTWPRQRTLKFTGEKNALEIKGNGQQFVAFGPHPSGEAYVWPIGSPRDRSYVSLPVVVDSQIDALSENLADAALLVRDTGKEREPKPVMARLTAPLEQLLDVDGNPVAPGVHSLRSDLVENFTANVPDVKCLSVGDAEVILMSMPNDYPLGHPLRLDRATWLRIAFACHATVDAEAVVRGDPPGVVTPQYREDDALLRDAFCVFSGNYTEDPNKKPADAEQLWETSRNPTDVSPGTLVYLARERIPNFILPSLEED